MQDGTPHLVHADLNFEVHFSPDTLRHFLNETSQALFLYHPVGLLQLYQLLLLPSHHLLVI